MASLYEALFPGSAGEDKIPVHPFASTLREHLVGEITKQQALDHLGLDPVEDAIAITQIETLITRMDSCTTDFNKTNYLSQLYGVLLMIDADWGGYLGDGQTHTEQDFIDRVMRIPIV